MSEFAAPPVSPLARFRKLRIAVSVFFGLLTVALCVLWVRSYWQADVLDLKLTNRNFETGAAVGVFSFGRLSANNISGWEIHYEEIEITDSIRKQIKPNHESGLWTP